VTAIVRSTNFHERVTAGVRAWQREEAPSEVVDAATHAETLDTGIT
jgi:hypothetical protein